MDQAHLHLVMNHLPVFVTVSGTLILLYAWKTRSKHTIIASYGLFILAALGAGITYLTGEGAEETVERLPGVVSSAIERHEDFAPFALASAIVLGLLSIAGMIAEKRASRYTKSFLKLILVVSIVSLSLMGRTGYLGGLIRHNEIGSNTTAASLNVSPEDDD